MADCKEKKEKRKRTRCKVDKEKFEDFCKNGFSEKAIAEFFDCDRTTINNFCLKEYNSTFSSFLYKKKQETKTLLVKAGIEKILRGDCSPALHIFYLKNWCGYKDNVEERKDSTMQQLIDAFKQWSN